MPEPRLRPNPQPTASPKPRRRLSLYARLSRPIRPPLPLTGCSPSSLPRAARRRRLDARQLYRGRPRRPRRQPRRSGELKKQVQMVAEGSVLYAGDALRAARRRMWRPMASPIRCFAPASPWPFRCPLPEVAAMMRYRLTCLTPLLVGDGRKLSPIDYMVWKDHVNVLDQWRIFRLLAKGPRLEGYLAQLKKADKLDFASWGGFAQNFAGRRIPFENAAYSHYWNRASRREPAHSRRSPRALPGRICPATAIKGALRTGMVFANWRDGMLQDVPARVQGRAPAAPSGGSGGRAGARAGRRQPHALRGRRRFRAGGQRAVQSLSAAHLHPAAARRRLRAGLEAEPARRGGWRAGPKTARRRSPKWRCPAPRSRATGTRRRSSCSPRCGARCAGRKVSTARAFSKRPTSMPPGLLALQRQYASWAGLGLLDQSLAELEQRLAEARDKGACLLSLGWGGGLHRQERLARHHQRRLPPDSAAVRRSTTAPWPATCRSPRRAGSCS